MTEETQGRNSEAMPCGSVSTARRTSRRFLLETLLGLSAAGTLCASLDATAWQAYEAVEEAWIRDRHELLMQHAPAVLSAARIDLELKLADLQRRAMQFRYLLGSDPSLLRGGIWQMTALPISDHENLEMMSNMPEYRKQNDRIRTLTEALRRHSQYDMLRRAQIRLWKTPHYREVHRRYMGRMQELQRSYGSGSGSGSDLAIAGGSR